ncbi:MAG: sensor histidine kinase [Myxococcota bacterium]
MNFKRGLLVGALGLSFGLGLLLAPSEPPPCAPLLTLRTQELAWEEQLEARLDGQYSASALAASLTKLEQDARLTQQTLGPDAARCAPGLAPYLQALSARRAAYEKLEGDLRTLEGERRKLLAQLETSAAPEGQAEGGAQALQALVQLHEPGMKQLDSGAKIPPLLESWWTRRLQVEHEARSLESLTHEKFLVLLEPETKPKPAYPVEGVGKGLVVLGFLIMLVGLWRLRQTSPPPTVGMSQPPVPDAARDEQKAADGSSDEVGAQSSPMVPLVSTTTASSYGLAHIDEAQYLLAWLSHTGELAVLLQADGQVIQATLPLELSLGLNAGGLTGLAGVERLFPERLHGTLYQRLKLSAPENSLRGWEDFLLKQAGGGEQPVRMLLLPFLGPARRWVLLLRDQELQQQKRQLEEQMRSNTLQLQASSLELKRSRARQAAIFESAMDSILGIDAHGQVVECNPAAEDVFGVAERGVLGLNLGELVISSSRTGRFHIGEGGEVWGEEHLPLARRREVTAVRPDGTLFPAEMQVVKVQMDPPLAYYVFLQDISERKRVEQLKNEFVSTVSHELRTPLTSIRGSLGLLEGGVLGTLPPRVLEMIRIARSNSDRLIRLTSEMLDLEKIEAGRLTLRLEPLSAGEVVEGAISGLNGMAAQCGVKLRVEEVQAGTFSGDRDRLLQVLTNLLSNAIKYSQAGQEVRLQVSAEPGALRFAVIDQGPGIPRERLPSLFKKFQQLESPDGVRRKGTGLGLAISRALVELHHGTIGVHSEVGKGSTFWFRLPLGLRHGGGTTSSPLVQIG